MSLAPTREKLITWVMGEEILPSVTVTVKLSLTVVFNAWTLALFGV